MTEEIASDIIESDENNVPPQRDIDIQPTEGEPLLAEKVETCDRVSPPTIEKRKPGRPVGSRNKSTLLKIEREAASKNINSIESDESLSTDTGEGNVKSIEPPLKEKAKPKTVPRKAKTKEPLMLPTRHEAAPELENIDDQEPATPVRMKHIRPSQLAAPQRMTYLEALTSGINDIINERSRARSAKYDSFFSSLK